MTPEEKCKMESRIKKFEKAHKTLEQYQKTTDINRSHYQ